MKKISEMTLQELKDRLEKLNEFIKETDGRNRFCRLAKNERDIVSRRIWKLENPESYENHRQALKEFLENTNVFAN